MQYVEHSAGPRGQVDYAPKGATGKIVHADGMAVFVFWRSQPGIQDILRRLTASENPIAPTFLSPEQLVDRCLDLVGPLPVAEKTRDSLISKAQTAGPAPFGTPEEKERFAGRVGEMLQLIVATREFQLA